MLCLSSCKRYSSVNTSEADIDIEDENYLDTNNTIQEVQRKSLNARIIKTLIGVVVIGALLQVSISFSISSSPYSNSTQYDGYANSTVKESPSIASAVIHSSNHNSDKFPEANEDDIIYQKTGASAIVNDEYKLIYFHIGKIASSEFKRFLKRLNNDPTWCVKDQFLVHRIGTNGLKYLAYDYSLKEVEHMMTSDEWTKAIFVRDPKPRLLSGFLDKAVQHKNHFEKTSCETWKYWKGVDDAQYCYDHRKDFSFFLHDITRMNTDDLHFRPVDSFVDKKWWPYVNFIGYMDSLSEDSKQLFKSIKSNVDGINAWDRVGKNGWSPQRGCDNVDDEEFLQARPSKHKTGAREHMQQYYTEELEKFVETNWASDYEHEFINFPEIKLFDHDDDDSNINDRKLVDDGRDWWSI